MRFHIFPISVNRRVHKSNRNNTKTVLETLMTGNYLAEITSIRYGAHLASRAVPSQPPTNSLRMRLTLLPTYGAYRRIMRVSSNVYEM